MTDDTRMIEAAAGFPLKQTSLDSVHEKNVRHGHISTLHIWPARRPLAACRAALAAALLPNPAGTAARKALVERIGGRLVATVRKRQLPGGQTVEHRVEETVGGVLHWGREDLPDLDWLRQRILEANNGQPPRVLDPFAGGGAIPLEAMRLGCQVTAGDINPVAWLILKCTLEYPQLLAGEHRSLPKFALESVDFMEAFFKGTGRPTKRQLARNLEAVGQGLFPEQQVDVSWHVRAWGWWVLQRAAADLCRFYPTVDDKPPVAYLWARTIACKNCRGSVPLLKTRWLSRKAGKRALITMNPSASGDGVVFDVQNDVPPARGNRAQRREHDRRLGQGTMSRSGGRCPLCGTISTMEDIRRAGRADRLGAVMTAVVVDGGRGKEYRRPTAEELGAAAEAAEHVAAAFTHLPGGIPDEQLTEDTKRNTWCVTYGVDQFHKLFTARQLLALGTFVRHTRSVREAMADEGYPPAWIEAVSAYLALAVDRLADRGSTVCSWTVGRDIIRNTFTRFALPMAWDYAEAVPTIDSSGGYPGAVNWIALYLTHALKAANNAPPPTVVQQSAITPAPGEQYDAIVTDPPYYDEIGYSNLMDFFYVWLRRTLQGLTPEMDRAFAASLGPKWDAERADGELIDDASRFAGDKEQSRRTYEDGMFRAFQACRQALRPDGRLVIVFAHKQPDAWEALVSAVIRAGFAVTASWPIQTERSSRTRALGSAALSSSIWLVCRRRPEAARPGWDNRVLEDMRSNIADSLRKFWDAGIRGPDFIWSATGPALEAYSSYPAVKKADEPGQAMTVAEFLRHVRRLVVDFIVGEVLSRNGDGEYAANLDDVTTYYLLHRHDFGLDYTSAGACILYAVSCNLSDATLAGQHDLIHVAGGADDSGENEDDDEAADEAEDTGPGSDSAVGSRSLTRVRLKGWDERSRRVGLESATGAAPPLIDRVHRLMRIWREGDVVQVDDYLDDQGLRGHPLFAKLLQALIELTDGEERSLLESISNHVATRGPSSRLPSHVQAEFDY